MKYIGWKVIIILIVFFSFCNVYAYDKCEESNEYKKCRNMGGNASQCYKSSKCETYISKCSYIFNRATDSLAVKPISFYRYSDGTVTTDLYVDEKSSLFALKGNDAKFTYVNSGGNDAFNSFLKDYGKLGADIGNACPTIFYSMEKPGDEIFATDMNLKQPSVVEWPFSMTSNPIEMNKNYESIGDLTAVKTTTTCNYTREFLGKSVPIVVWMNSDGSKWVSIDGASKKIDENSNSGKALNLQIPFGTEQVFVYILREKIDQIFYQTNSQKEKNEFSCVNDQSLNFIKGQETYSFDPLYKNTYQMTTDRPVGSIEEQGSILYNPPEVAATDGDPSTGCSILGTEFYNYLQDVLDTFEIVAPILAIVLGMSDFVKAAASGEEEAKKKAIKTFGKRLFASMLLFLVPAILELILSLIGRSGSTCGLT